MSHLPSTPETRYETLVETLIGAAGVSIGPPKQRGFGASTLCVSGKIFTMLVRSKLVVKLPAARVDALVVAGAGERYDPRHDGRLMKEWLVVAPASEGEWLALAREALAFVDAHS
jgi:hypothetical protein